MRIKYQYQNKGIYGEKENAKELTQIYSQGKGSDSPRSFRYQRAKRIDKRALSEIIKKR